MTDAEYVFKQTSLERKRDGRGYYHKKRQGGKHVRLSSDALSKKEREKMNGEVKTYRFNKPVKWDEFVRMPDDIKQEYMDLLIEKFNGVSNAMIAESMGCSPKSFSPFLCRHGIKFKNRKKLRDDNFFASENGIAWVKWHEDSKDINRKADDKVEDEAEETAEVKADEKVEVNDENIDKIMKLIRGLAGTGAKLTIEFTL